jgi:hypothetical protein
MEELSVTSLPRQKAAARSCAFTIRGWAAWAPDRTTEADWQRWAGVSNSSLVSLASTTPPPTSLRRRVTPVGQAALRCGWGLSDIATARFILASRHGEYARTLSILETLTKGDGVSPADFTLSVHHALIGLLSIATQNRHGHTAIAAGCDSFAFGLLEAAACLVERPDQPVVYLYFDEPLPAPYDDFYQEDEQALALGLLLTASGDNPMTVEMTGEGMGRRSATSQALDFIRFILSDSQECSSPSQRLTWVWRRHASGA